MLKKTLLAISITALSSAALSAPIVNLKVQGSITPPTCTIESKNEVDVVYNFDISPSLFPVSGNLTLDGKSENIQIVCDATTYLAFEVEDNRSSSELELGNNNFGLGIYDLGGADTKIGYYNIQMSNAKTQQNVGGDFVDVGILTGTEYNTSSLLDKTQTTAWAIDVNNLAPGQVFSADFEVTPTINADMKSISGDASLDGHAILTFKFGI